jgi:hypothetical protein
MRNVDWIVIVPTVTYVWLVAFALWVGLGTKRPGIRVSGAMEY